MYLQNGETYRRISSKLHAVYQSGKGQRVGFTRQLTGIEHRHLGYVVNFFYVSGYRIPEVENLGATGDQFDTIDFSENDIRKLDGFPYLKRLKCLLLNNNRVVYVGFLYQPIYLFINVDCILATGELLSTWKITFLTWKV